MGRSEVALEIDGVFDVPAAREVEGVIAAARAGEAVWVDLSRVREFHDAGVAILAEALRRCGASVTLHGLRRHQTRVLRYLGVGARAPPRAAEERG